MKKRKIPKGYTPNDKFFYMAQKEGYRARSAYKLIEIQERFSLIHPGQNILDLGAAPGSFLQVAAKYTKKTGTIIGLDLQKIKSLKKPHIHTFVVDIFDTKQVEKILDQFAITQCDLILSDLAPKTTGIRDIDQYKSVELNLQVLEIIKHFLIQEGNAVFKIFQGEDFESFMKEAKKVFARCTEYKPKACRDRSFETYIIGQNKLS